MRVDNVVVGVPGEHTQVDSRLLSQPRHYGKDAHAVATPVLTQDQQPKTGSGPPKTVNGVGLYRRRSIDSVPQLGVLDHSAEVFREGRRCGVAGGVDEKRHREGVCPTGCKAAREYDSVNVTV